MVNDGKASPLKIEKETMYHRDQVTYISDKVCMNLRVQNAGAKEVVADWSPPNIKSGSRQHCSVSSP